MSKETYNRPKETTSYAKRDLQITGIPECGIQTWCQDTLCVCVACVSRHILHVCVIILHILHICVFIHRHKPHTGYSICVCVCVAYVCVACVSIHILHICVFIHRHKPHTHTHTHTHTCRYIRICMDFHARTHTHTRIHTNIYV